MKVEPIAYNITFPDGEMYQLERMLQRDDSILWCVREDPTGFFLGRDLEWHHEPFNSSRTDEYLKNTRFKYDEAINIIISFRALEEQKRKAK